MRLPSNSLRRALWAICDQGFLSASNFIVTIQLARYLHIEQYGEFALLLSFFFICQLISSSLILYPLTLTIAGATSDTPRVVIATAFLLVGAITVCFMAVMASSLIGFGYQALLLPASACLFSFLILDAVRKVVLAQFRYRMAMISSLVTAICQISAVTALAWSETLSLTSSLYAVAAAYAAGISTLIWNVGVAPTSIRKAIALAATFWPNGKWAFANGLMITLRAQIFPWALAAYAGPSAVAGFQAVMNVSNLTNPVINGLNNAIPQAAAEAASRSSLAAAWEATLGYVIVGAPFVFGYCALVWLVPEEVLKAFYGKSSPYLDLYFSARIIMLATAFNYLAEMICTFLHGIGHGRVAIRMNGNGFGVAVLSLPLVTLYGISGACIALALANIVRLGSGYFIVSRFSFLAGRSAIRI